MNLFWAMTQGSSFLATLGWMIQTRWVWLIPTSQNAAVRLPIGQHLLHCFMRTVEEIKKAIERLSPEERAELETLLHPRLDHEWDPDLKEAAPAGKPNGPVRKTD